jgi:hypothetical protein
METPRRGRANRVIDLRERDPEPRPARWPADGWSLGSVAPSGPRIAWATSGASTSMRTKATEAQLGSAPAPSREIARPARPDVARSPRPGAGAARTSPRTPSERSQLPPLPQWDSPRQPRPASPRPQMAGAARTAPARQAGPGRPGAPVRQPAAGHLPAKGAASRPAPRPVARPAPDANRPARWRVIDLTPEPRKRPIPAPAPSRIANGRQERQSRQETEAQRWALAAGAESQGAPGPLPAVFRLDPVHARNEAGSRAR